MKRSRRSRVAFLLRISVSAAFLFLLLQRVSVSEVLASLSQSLERWPLVLASFVLPGIGVIVAASRWQVLLDAVGSRVPLGRLSKAFLVGNFFNQFFPSTIAGDLARGWWIQSTVRSGTLSLTVVTTDRLLGFVGIVSVAVAVLVTRQDVLQTPYLTGLVIGFFVLGLAAIVLGMRYTGWLTRLIQVLKRKPQWTAIGQRVEIAYLGLRQLAASHRQLSIALGLAVLLQLVIMAHFAFLAFVLRIEVNYWDLASIVPLVSLATFLPISINGIGVREVSLASLGALVGLSPEDAVTLSWAFLIISTLYALLGGGIYATGRGSAREEPRSGSDSTVSK